VEAGAHNARCWRFDMTGRAFFVAAKEGDRPLESLIGDDRPTARATLEPLRLRECDRTRGRSTARVACERRSIERARAIDVPTLPLVACGAPSNHVTRMHASTRQLRTPRLIVPEGSRCQQTALQVVSLINFDRRPRGLIIHYYCWIRHATLLPRRFIQSGNVGSYKAAIAALSR